MRNSALIIKKHKNRFTKFTNRNHLKRGGFFYGNDIKLGGVRGVFRYPYSFCVNYLAINSSKSSRM
jgi:hypothetical protein